MLEDEHTVQRDVDVARPGNAGVAAQVEGIGLPGAFGQFTVFGGDATPDLFNLISIRQLMFDANNQFLLTNL